MSTMEKLNTLFKNILTEKTFKIVTWASLTVRWFYFDRKSLAEFHKLRHCRTCCLHELSVICCVCLMRGWLLRLRSRCCPTAYCHRGPLHLYEGANTVRYVLQTLGSAAQVQQHTDLHRHRNTHLQSYLCTHLSSSHVMLNSYSCSNIHTPATLAGTTSH